MRRCYLLVLTLGMGLTWAPIVHADPHADALLKKVIAHYKAIKSFSATLSTSAIISLTKAGSTTTVRFTETLKLQKPNLAYIVPAATIQVEGAGAAQAMPNPITISNGTTLWTFNKAANTYQTAKVDPEGGLIVLNSNALGVFYQPGVLLASDVKLLNDLAPTTASSRIVGVEKVDGLSCQVVEMRLYIIPKPDTQPLTRKMRFYIGQDNLVHRIVQDSTIPKGGSLHQEETLTDIRINPTLPTSGFTFIPPPGAKNTTQDQSTK